MIGQARAEDKPTLTDTKQKVSYSIGVSLGTNWKRQDIDIDFDTFMRGLKDSMSGGQTLLTEAEMKQVLTDYQKELRTKQEEKRKVLGEKNKKEGDAFLAENKKKDGVITLPSGVQYKVLAEGKGENPKAVDTVTVNYRGTLIDGTEFDSSAQRGPATFALNRVIKGWTEALELMKPGAKWQLVIPPALAYGEFGSGPKIGPNATLVFDVELLSFKPPTPATNAPPVTSDIIKVPSAEELKKGAKIEVIKKEDVPNK